MGLEGLEREPCVWAQKGWRESPVSSWHQVQVFSAASETRGWLGPAPSGSLLVNVYVENSLKINSKNLII
jgi:hypothetical protein